MSPDQIVTHDIVLEGCRPEPLAHYLKALAVLRLVAEQADPAAHGAWQNDRFVLRSTLDREALVRFFLHDYEPTPIVSPWNGGSGFFPKDNKEGPNAISAGAARRFGTLRTGLHACRTVLEELELTDKPDKKDKPRLLEACRARLPDESLSWLDASLVLSESGPRFPPLLGTGGNDGRLDFGNNFMKRLVGLFDADTGEPNANALALLDHALFAVPTSALEKAPVGQFLPGTAGGANATAGFDGDAQVNPWDFVLAFEGAALFAAAVARRLDAGTSALSYPFTVRPVGAGHRSAAQADESTGRDEMWLPVWDRFATAGELRAVFAEGRATVGRRPARSATDVARALGTLGVDRGLTEFIRYGFQRRNGLAYLAVPLQRIRNRDLTAMRLLDEIDSWLERFRSAARGKLAPASVSRVARALDDAIFRYADRGGRQERTAMFLALGDAEVALVRSLRWTEDAYLRPMPGLSSRWLAEAGDGSAEFRLAVSLASLDGKAGRVRTQLEPVVGDRFPRWNEKSGPGAVWAAGDAAGCLTALFQRRLLAEDNYADRATAPARLDDIARFIEGDMEDGLFLRWLRACVLVRSPGPAPAPALTDPVPIPPLYALLKPCFAAAPVLDADVPTVPGIVRLAAAGRADAASRLAARRLRGSGLLAAIDSVRASLAHTRRTAAALLFPLTPMQVERLAARVLRPHTEGEPL